ncbi:MAG: hypothetical protein GF344_04550 [Chitinivibrionales bacterium]|nr:hypothetical protein [Chitinivibrionales bacterium]
MKNRTRGILVSFLSILSALSNLLAQPFEWNTIESQLKRVVPIQLGVEFEGMSYEEFEFTEFYKMNYIYDNKIVSFLEQEDMSKLFENDSEAQWFTIVLLDSIPISMLSIAYFQNDWQIVKISQPRQLPHIYSLVKNNNSITVEFFEYLYHGGEDRYFVHFNKINTHNLTRVNAVKNACNTKLLQKTTGENLNTTKKIFQSLSNKYSIQRSGKQ